MTIGELVFDLGFHADTMKLKDFGKAVGELNMTSILATGSFGALYEGAKKIIDMADDLGEGVLKFGRETGQSTQEIQKWSTAAQEMGISGETIGNSVAHLEDQIFKMRMTGEGSGIWALIGIDPTKTGDMFQVLTSIRERLKGLSTERQRFLLEGLGISTEMLNLFKMSDAQWADINKQQTQSSESLAKIQEYNADVARTSRDFKLIWADIAVTLLPAIDSFLKISGSIATMARESQDFKGILDLLTFSAKGWSMIIEKTAEGWGDILRLMRMAGITSSNIAKAGGVAKALAGADMGPVAQMEYGIASPWGMISKQQNSSPVNVNVKVNKAGPETTVETTSDQGQLNSTVKNIVNQKPAGQS